MSVGKFEGTALHLAPPLYDVIYMPASFLLVSGTAFTFFAGEHFDTDANSFVSLFFSLCHQAIEFLLILLE